MGIFSLLSIMICPITLPCFLQCLTNEYLIIGDDLSCWNTHWWHLIILSMYGTDTRQ
jgi:hypothetical protein